MGPDLNTVHLRGCGIQTIPLCRLWTAGGTGTGRRRYDRISVAVRATPVVKEISCVSRRLSLKLPRRLRVGGSVGQMTGCGYNKRLSRPFMPK
jgi:hypothetical protein